MKQKNETHSLLCIVCPEGCEMDVTEADGELVFPDGICRRGQDYARQEIYDPSRVLTTTVPITGGETAMLPVRTVEAIPKPLLIEAMEQIASIRVSAPVRIGDTVVEDVAGTGTPLVASRTVRVRA